MFKHRISISGCVILGIITSGCAHTEPQLATDTTIIEFHPDSPAAEKKAPSTGDYTLWIWEPSRDDTGELVSRPRQLEELRVKKNVPVGFRNTDGQLIAYAGPTTMPLAMAQYCWRTNPKSVRRPAPNVREVLLVVATCGLYLVVMAAATYVNRGTPDSTLQ